MTDSQPGDLTTRVDNIDEQLEEILDELDLIAAIQNSVRREVRTSSQSSARLERTVRQLAEISARTQAQVVKNQDELEQYRADIKQNQENINRILAYLENPNRGDTPPN